MREEQNTRYTPLAPAGDEHVRPSYGKLGGAADEGFYLKLRIQSIEVRNYRSCQRVSMTLDEHLSVLIGPNGSGKTTVLNAIQLLKAIYSPAAMAGPLSGRRPCLLEVTFASRSGSTIGLRTSIDVVADDHNRDLVSLNKVEIRYAHRKTQSDWERVDGPNNQLGYRFHDAFAFGIIPTGQKASQLLEHVRIFAESIKYYQASRFTDPSQSPVHLEIEEGNPLTGRRARRDAHSAFLYEVYQAKTNQPESYQEFERFVGRTGIGLIDRISFRTIKAPTSQIDVRIGGRIEPRKTTRLIVIPTIHIGRSKLSANQLSEGTFRALALVFYILADKSQLLLIEEPEVCVHHGLLRSIIALIQSVARDKQVVVSTHSDLILNTLSPEQVFLVARSNVNGTTVQTIPDSLSAREYAGLRGYMMETGNLGEFWRSGGLD